MHDIAEPLLCKPPPKLRDIAETVSKHYGVTVVDLVAYRRTARVLRPRQVFCYLARIMTFRSFPEIGLYLGRRDHTTILHAFNKISCLLPTDPGLAAEVRAIRQQLEGA